MANYIKTFITNSMCWTISICCIPIWYNTLFSLDLIYNDQHFTMTLKNCTQYFIVDFWLKENGTPLIRWLMELILRIYFTDWGITFDIHACTYLQVYFNYAITLVILFFCFTFCNFLICCLIWLSTTHMPSLSFLTIKLGKFPISDPPLASQRAFKKKLSTFLNFFYIFNLKIKGKVIRDKTKKETMSRYYEICIQLAIFVFYKI